MLAGSELSRYNLFMKFVVRAERPEDGVAIRRLNQLAFGRPEEANLVDALRQAGKARVSLVALEGEEVVGHILFSPVSVPSAGSTLAAVGLGPMAVLPEFQRRGIGSELVRRGLEQCAEHGERITVVLGHPKFYPRFGFVRASDHGLRCEYPVPDEVFMVAELEEGALRGLSGVVQYASEFGGV